MTGMIGGLHAPRPSGAHAARRGIPFFVAGVCVLMFFLAFSRYDAVALEFRGTDAVDLFNCFWRLRLPGGITFFDVLVFGLGGLLAVRAVASGKLKRSPFDPLAVGLAALVGVSVIVKLIWGGPEDNVKDWLFSIRNYAYFLTIYLLVSRLNWSEARFQKLMKLVVALTVMTFVLSAVDVALYPRRVAKYGEVALTRDIDDFLFSFFLLFYIVGLKLEGARLPAWQWALAIAYAFYSILGGLTGGSKSTLIVYPILLLYYAWYYKLYVHAWFKVLAAIVVMAVPVGAWYVVTHAAEIDETSRLHLLTTFNPDDLSYATRIAETANFGLNMYDRNAYVLGIGVGSKWREYIPQIKADKAAYPPDEWDSEWHLGTHVPLLRVALDFGVIGCVALLGLFYACFRRSLRLLRSGRLHPVTSAFVQASWMAIAYQVTISNLGDPKTNLLAGFLLGANSGLVAAAVRRRLRGSARARAGTRTGFAASDGHGAAADG